MSRRRGSTEGSSSRILCDDTGDVDSWLSLYVVAASLVVSGFFHFLLPLGLPLPPRSFLFGFTEARGRGYDGAERPFPRCSPDITLLRIRRYDVPWSPSLAPCQPNQRPLPLLPSPLSFEAVGRRSQASRARRNRSLCSAPSVSADQCCLARFVDDGHLGGRSGYCYRLVIDRGCALRLVSDH